MYRRYSIGIQIFALSKRESHEGDEYAEGGQTEQLAGRGWRLSVGRRYVSIALLSPVNGMVLNESDISTILAVA